MELLYSNKNKEESDDQHENPQLTALSEVLKMVKAAGEKAIKKDPLMEGSLQLRRDLQTVLIPYKEH